MASLCFVEFHVNDAHRFAQLRSAFGAIRHDKLLGRFRDEEDWLVFFDDGALGHFWWPTSEEFSAYQARWRAATVEQKLRDKALTAPSWTFGSFLLAFENGDYDLVACELVGDGCARLEFDPHGFPYGGTGCMRMLIRAFGFPIIGEDDGTGYRKFADDDL